MVLIAPHINVDTFSGSGSIHSIQNPPAIYRTLISEELINSLGFCFGSGGVPSGCFSSISGSGSKVIMLRVDVKEITSFKMTLDYISSTFELTKDELAQICQVQSRKTLYNWIDEESTPRRSALERIFKLYTVALTWRELGYDFDKKALHAQIVDSKTIVDLLSEDNIDRDLIIFAGSRMQLSRGGLEVIDDPFA